MHQVRFPNESDAYRKARNALLEREAALRAELEAVAAQRRELPLGGRIPDDYLFVEATPGAKGRQVRLSEMFEDDKRHLLIHSWMYADNMEHPCPRCTSYLDGVDGYVPHISRRMNLAAVAKSPADRLHGMIERRGWRHLRVYSWADNQYGIDYPSQTPDGGQIPACNVFTKTDDGVFHTWAAELLYAFEHFVDGAPRHLDLLWPVRSFLNMTRQGRGSDDWLPNIAEGQ